MLFRDNSDTITITNPFNQKNNYIISKDLPAYADIIKIKDNLRKINNDTFCCGDNKDFGIKIFENEFYIGGISGNGDMEG